MPSHTCQQLEPGKLCWRLRTAACAGEVAHKGNATITFAADPLIRLRPALFAMVVEVGQ
jgi:hypothetical protein